jgi:hypothetical protein
VGSVPAYWGTLCRLSRSYASSAMRATTADTTITVSARLLNTLGAGPAIIDDTSPKYPVRGGRPACLRSISDDLNASLRTFARVH